jgi:mRNA interferase MazF
MVKFVPKLGDIVLMDFDPTLGHEQRGFRPALVLSDYDYNVRTKFFICSPITTKIKGYPFEVALASSLKTKGVILSDQIKSCDLQVRKPRFVEEIDIITLEQVQYNLMLILNLN